MRSSNIRALSLVAIILGIACCDVSAPQESTPLKDAVAAVNKEAVERLTNDSRVKEQNLSEDQLPEPLTVEEVVAALRSWKPERSKDPKVVSSIFEKIVETEVLPPRARLGCHLQWFGHDEHGKEDDKYDYLVWRFELDVYTSETTGYLLVIRRQILGRRIAMRPTPGYWWVVKPHSVSPVPSTPTHLWGKNVRNFRFVVDEAPDGSLLVTAAWVPEWISRGPEFAEEVPDVRAVAFDESGNRHFLDRDYIGHHHSSPGGTLRMARCRLDPNQLAVSEVRHLGFEALSRGGLKIASEAAVQEAREKGIEILSLPEVGRRYEISLTTTDGKVIDSEKLRGKVVLIHCWESWCGPCKAQMPAVKKVYEKWHPKGLEVLGVSSDEDVKSAENAYERLEIHWPLVVVPSDTEVRVLWRRAARITTIPRYLLIDREGILRAHLSGSKEIEKELDQQVAALFQGSSDEAGDPSHMRLNPVR
jgi:thiol-disulfide isomerase/thioredoxin